MTFRKMALIMALLTVMIGSQVGVRLYLGNQKVARSTESEKMARLDQNVPFILAKCEKARINPAPIVGIHSLESGGYRDIVSGMFWNGRVKDADVGAFQLSIYCVPENIREKVRQASYACRNAQGKTDFEKKFAYWRSKDPRFDFNWSLNVAIAHYQGNLQHFGEPSLAITAYNAGRGGVNSAIRAEAQSKGQAIGKGHEVRYARTHGLTVNKMTGGGKWFLRTRRARPDLYCLKVMNNLDSYNHHRKMAGLSPINSASKSQIVLASAKVQPKPAVKKQIVLVSKPKHIIITSSKAHTHKHVAQKIEPKRVIAKVKVQPVTVAAVEVKNLRPQGQKQGEKMNFFASAGIWMLAQLGFCAMLLWKAYITEVMSLGQQALVSGSILSAASIQLFLFAIVLPMATPFVLKFRRFWIIRTMARLLGKLFIWTIKSLLRAIFKPSKPKGFRPDKIYVRGHVNRGRQVPPYTRKRVTARA
jgi:hypothetical protein